MDKKNTVKTAPVKSLAEVIVDLEMEFDEITGRVERIDADLNKGAVFAEQVGAEQYSLICEQFHAMREYRDRLAVRLSRLRRANAKAIEAEIKEKEVKA